MPSACLDDDVALLLAEGHSSSEQWGLVREHLASCSRCAELIAEVLREERTEASARPFEETGIRGQRQGDVIGHRWRLLHWLGAGCAGSVWEAEDTEGIFGRRAVKLVDLQKEDRERFRRESRLLAGLEHPNIVRAYDAFETQTAGGLVLEMLVGESLAARLTHGPPVSFDAGLGILRAIARALAFAHERGVVHRDLKPSNVFLSRETPRVRVLDLGLAVTTEAWTGGTLASITVTGAGVGTPLYMAPEQLFREDGAARAPQVDSWALGLLAHEILVGSLPFEIGPLGKLLRAVRQAPFEAVSARARARARGADFPDVLDSLVAQWLSFDAAERASTASAARRLDEIAQARGVDDGW